MNDQKNNVNSSIQRNFRNQSINRTINRPIGRNSYNNGLDSDTDNNYLSNNQSFENDDNNINNEDHFGHEIEPSGNFNSNNEFPDDSISPSQYQKIRNDSNNADAVKSAANIASNSGHPVAMGIGKSIQAADKLTGGKASKELGKKVTKANRLLPGGGLRQKAINKLVENGTADKINKINSMKGSPSGINAGQATPNRGSGLRGFFSNSSGFGNQSTQKKEVEESYDDGNQNFKLSYKTIMTLAIASVPAFLILIFMVLLVSGSQVFLQANTLGQADEVSAEKADEKIKALKTEKLDEEIEDDEVSYINDIYVDQLDEFENYEFADEKYRNKQEASLDDLKDFYPEIVNYTTDEYDQNDVYKFFMKLYNIYNYYVGQGVKLDMPLLMSILSLQSSDMGVVFKANTVDYTKEDIEAGSENEDFKIDKDWSAYKSTKNNSAHDIEILAQGMVKEGTSTEKDGDYVGDVEFMTGGIGKIYYFNQGDYPSSPYGSYGTIASHGCGPTALSIAISSLLKEVHDPIELTNYVCSIGGCTNAGSTWQSITDTPPHYGLKSKQTTNKQEVISSLGTGKSIVIVIMCPGHFTSGGHFITLTATKDNGMVTVADPASRDRSKDWPFNTVAEETCGSYWIVSK